MINLRQPAIHPLNASWVTGPDPEALLKYFETSNCTCEIVKLMSGKMCVCVFFKYRDKDSKKHIKTGK